MQPWKNDYHTFVGSGIVFPAVLALMALVQIATGKMYLPELRHRLRWVWPGKWHALSPAQWEFWCVGAAELGVAAYFLGWYGLANIEGFERFSRPLKALGYIGMTIGVLGLLASIVTTAVG